MGTVTQYNLANVQAALGGSNPISMSEYYRGGAYVPSTRTVSYTAREPSSGELYGNEYWRHDTLGDTLLILWGGGLVVNVNGVAASRTSWTAGGYTYYRGGYRRQTSSAFKGYVQNWYAIYRTYPSSYQQAINTGVPSGGAISISQLYGAVNP